MIRTLFIIAGAALVLCLVTLGGAAAIGGHDLQRHGWSWTLKDDNGESVRFERIKGGGTEDLGPAIRALPPAPLLCHHLYNNYSHASRGFRYGAHPVA